MSFPNQQEPRPRSKSVLSTESFKTHRSRDSNGNKIDLTESPKDKRRLHSKADPTMAINEMQPSFVALQESELENLRGIQHKDTQGHLITDPDRSNPTRPRFERPLDTIRNFEAAIEKHRSRTSTPKSAGPEDAMSGGFSRRNSYFGRMSNAPAPQNRGNTEGGFYANHNRRSGYGARPDSFVDGPGGPNQHHAHTRNGYNRGHSEPMLFGGQPQHVYPSHSYQQSYDTVTSGEQQWGTSTDPSSINSSVDRIQQPTQSSAQPGIPEDRVPTETYGFNGFGGKPQLDVQGPSGYGAQQNAQVYGTDGFNNGYQNAAPSGYGPPNAGAPISYRQPMPQENKPRIPIKLDSPAGDTLARTQSKVSAAGKRKSWFKKRFSKDRD